MSFAIGLIVGLVSGAMIGIFMIALVSANGRSKAEDDEQARKLSETKDKNEF